MSTSSALQAPVDPLAAEAGSLLPGRGYWAAPAASPEDAAPGREEGGDAPPTAAETLPAATPWASRVARADSTGDQRALEACMAELVAMDQDARRAALHALAAAMPERTGRATVGLVPREGAPVAQDRAPVAQIRALPLFQ